MFARACTSALVGILCASSFGLGCASSSDSAPGPQPEDPRPIPVVTAPVEGMMGPEGGVLTHPSGAKMVVPPGALSKTTRLTFVGIAPLSSKTLGATPLGQAFEAGPEGQTFLKPVEIIVPFDPTRLPPGVDAAHAQVRMAPHGGTSFSALDSEVDLASRMIRTWTVHFTQFVPALDPNPVFITQPRSLPDATVGIPYNQEFAVTGGTPPYTWSVGGAAVLPLGIQFQGLPSTNIAYFAGIPPIPTTFAFFAKVSDSAGHSVQKAMSFTVLSALSPAPSLSQVAPAAADQGSSTTAITLTGSGFEPSSVAQWDGIALPTTFVSGTELSASLATGLLANAGTHQVSVFTPPPGGGTSGSLDFVVNTVVQNPVPTITSVNPSLLPLTGTDTHVTIAGTNFTAATSAAIGVQGISTLFVSATELDATIPASYLGAPGTLQISVYNPPPGGGFSATTVPVTVQGFTWTPSITSLSPSQLPSGSADTVVTITGEFIAPGAQAFLDNTALATTVVSATSAQITVPAALLATARNASLLLVNPPPGGGASQAASLQITAGTGVTCQYWMRQQDCTMAGPSTITDVRFALTSFGGDPEGGMTSSYSGFSLAYKMPAGSAFWTSGNHISYVTRPEFISPFATNIVRTGNLVSVDVTVVEFGPPPATPCNLPFTRTTCAGTTALGL